MRMTPQVYTAHLPDGAMAVMDIRTGRGRWQHLNSTAGRLWRRLADGVPLDQALTEATDHFTGQGAERGAVRADLTALAEQLQDAGLLTARLTPAPPATALAVRPPVPPNARPSTADRAAGVLALAGALTLLRCAPIRVSIHTASTLGRLSPPRATAERADLLFCAVRRAGRWWPGRVACLEESLAVYLAALLRRRRVTWAVGARTAPAAAHAWIETHGEVIGQDLADRVWPYTPALRI